MKIFIGSSSKKKRIAQHVANKLKGAGFEVYRWWDHSVFKGGDITINRLIEMSNMCDGSVFIFGADDKILVRRSGSRQELVAPRDNVLLEYGIFAGKVGIKHTLFVTEPHVKVPTDLQGVTYIGKRGYADRIVSRFREVFSENEGKSSPSWLTVHINKRLIEKLLKGGDKGWVSRSLYIGAKGAQAWMEVENDQKYSGTRGFADVQKCIMALATKKKLCSFDTIISFGPGMGHLDKQIVPHLRGKQVAKYIPVDINYYLANYAAEAVDNAAKDIHVPFCIIGDFEDEMSLISEIIRKHTAASRVFMMLGGTFGNLERGENTFLDGLRSSMSSEDIAILDVFTKSGSYTQDNDHLLPLSAQPKSVKRYLAYGAQRYSGVEVEKVVQNIDLYIQPESMPHNKGSVIENTHAFSLQCKTTKRDIIYVRRYDFQSFKRHLESTHFHVVASQSVDSTATVTRSIFFIKRKE